MSIKAIFYSKFDTQEGMLDILLRSSTMLTFLRPKDHSSSPRGLYRPSERDPPRPTTTGLLIDLALSDPTSVSLWQSHLACSPVQPTVSHPVLPNMLEVFRLRPQ